MDPVTAAHTPLLLGADSSEQPRTARSTRSRFGRAGFFVDRLVHIPRLLAASALALLVGVFAALPATAQGAATVTTDLADYQPGATAQITGSGFGLNESVTLQVTHADGTAETFTRTDLDRADVM